MKKIIVTGATSMIGVALIEASLKDQSINKIYAVIRPNSYKINRLPQDPRIIVIPCDIKNYRELADIISEPCDVFYHLAWPRTATYEEDYANIYEKSENLQAVLGAVNAAIKLRCTKFIGAGSQSEYGLLDKEKLAPEDPCNPVRADGVLHLAAGQLAKIISENHGVSCIWMRIFSVYGKNDRENSLISSTIDKLRRGDHCSFTKSEQMWDYLSADDIGQAFYLVGKKVNGIHTYCVGSGEAKPLHHYINIIKDVVAPNAELGFGELPYPQNPVMNLCADISSLQKDTGWSPKIDFKEGIKQIFNHLDEQMR